MVSGVGMLWPHGNRIKALRLARAWSQYQLALFSQCSEKSISNWERGKHVPSLESIQALAAVFGVELSEIDPDRCAARPTIDLDAASCRVGPPKGIAIPKGLRDMSVRIVGNVIFVLGVKGEQGPLDWAPDWPSRVPRQERLIWIPGPSGEVVVLPHVVEAGPWDPGAGEDVPIRARPGFHLPRVSVPSALNEWNRRADAAGVVRPFSPPKGLARLCRAGPEGLVFQQVDYRDYVQTNLALDLDVGGGATLRDREVWQHCLVPLHRSDLANVVGTGVLLFTSDGFLVVQRRRTQKVLFRAGEVCAAGSGTLEWSDVLQCAGTLGDLDLFREAWEESGAREPVRPQLLAVTRELVRLDPGIWMASDLSAEAATVLSEDWERQRRDKEGSLHLVPMGEFGCALPARPPTPAEFWASIEAIAEIGPPSVPLLANLALWWQQAGHGRLGGIESMERWVT